MPTISPESTCNDRSCSTIRVPPAVGESDVDAVDVVETHVPCHTSAVMSGSPLTEPTALAIVT